MTGKGGRCVSRQLSFLEHTPINKQFVVWDCNNLYYTTTSLPTKNTSIMRLLFFTLLIGFFLLPNFPLVAQSTVSTIDNQLLAGVVPPVSKKKKETPKSSKVERKQQRKAKRQQKQQKRQGYKITKKQGFEPPLNTGLWLFGTIVLLLFLTAAVVLGLSGLIGLGGFIISLMVSAVVGGILNIIALIFTLLGIQKLHHSSDASPPSHISALIGAILLFLAIVGVFLGIYVSVILMTIAFLALIIGAAMLWINIGKMNS